jgi:hypothetical protein
VLEKQNGKVYKSVLWWGMGVGAGVGFRNLFKIEMENKFNKISVGRDSFL